MGLLIKKKKHGRRIQAEIGTLRGFLLVCVGVSSVGITIGVAPNKATLLFCEFTNIVSSPWETKHAMGPLNGSMPSALSLVLRKFQRFWKFLSGLSKESPDFLFAAPEVSPRDLDGSLRPEAW